MPIYCCRCSHFGLGKDVLRRFSRRNDRMSCPVCDAPMQRDLLAEVPAKANDFKTIWSEGLGVAPRWLNTGGSTRTLRSATMGSLASAAIGRMSVSAKSWASTRSRNKKVRRLEYRRTSMLGPYFFTGQQHAGISSPVSGH